MAMNLQEKAELVFQKEREAKERQQAHNTTGRRTSLASPDQYLRNRRGVATSLRALVDLLGIKDLYVHMHAQFSWILKAAGRQRLEKVVQGRRARRVEDFQTASHHDGDVDSKGSREKSPQLSLAPSASSSTTVTSASSIPPATPGTAPVVLGLTTIATGTTISMGLVAQDAPPEKKNAGGPRQMEDKVKVAEK
ncbi:hypothetical protein BC937DRAFT_86612 [Endogone sp. FLAS-F59071]|nr:hypothetical protein BC937DRAFT_86612 [Endogone sp. FLAS-F59071]|eukprot:RUS12959.1 hypothetical protein BC937DRAFT_86612 [Endogone sp. FLAS-F59071]